MPVPKQEGSTSFKVILRGKYLLFDRNIFMAAQQNDVLTRVQIETKSSEQVFEKILENLLIENTQKWR